MHARRRSFRIDRSRARRGTVLVWLVLLLVALLGVAALVIDVARARFAQQRMQSAVDFAAQEMLRFRDDAPPLPLLYASLDDPGACSDPDDVAVVIGCHAAESGAAPGSPELRDHIRRKVAVLLVRRMTSPSAAPEVDLNASPNLANDPAGDMVAGEFQYLAATPDEADDYARADFTPAAGAAAPTADATLVRIRNTGETLAADAGLSGQRVPYLFGRGTLLAPAAKNDGIAVRATAIARSTRATRVGAARGGVAGIPGCLPFAVRRTVWQSAGMASAMTVRLRIEPTGELSLVDSGGATAAGFVIDAGGISRVCEVGTRLTRDAGVTSAAATRAAILSRVGSTVEGEPVGFAPVVSETPGDLDRVVGFVWLGDLAAGMTSDELTCVPGVARIAAENATALPGPSGGVGVVVSPALWSEHLTFERPLMAPAGAR